MSEVKHRGTVIEVRADRLVMSQMAESPAFEFAHPVKPNDAQPGDYVWVYDDGQVEVKNRPPRLPANVTETTLPTNLDLDHS